MTLSPFAVSLKPMILENINSELYWVIIAVLALNLFQRKHTATAEKKRMATLLIASLVLGLNVMIAVILTMGLPQWTGIIALLIMIGVAYMIRNKILLFKYRCASCGKKLDMDTIFYHDDNLCKDCRKELYPDLYKDEEADDTDDDEEIDLLEHPEEARDVDDIDWDLWEPQETAVLCYIFKDGEVLLINKKTGLGKGMVNAPGGRIEEDETAAEAAVRETEEETGITPSNLVQVGILNFQFVDGYSLRGYIFFADDYTGSMHETDEADPFWVKETEIPYDKMWADDIHWLPKAMEGQFFEGKFIFDGEEMLSKHLDFRDR